MFKLSKRVDYGLILLSKLVDQPAAASSREMAERYNLPHPMVANILKQLTASGILISTRGAQGGYELAREPSNISLADVVRSLEGPFSLVDCTGGETLCKFSDFCPTHDPIQAVHKKFVEFMSMYKIDEIFGRDAKPALGNVSPCVDQTVS